MAHLETHGTPGAGPVRRSHPKSELLQCSATGLWGLATAAYLANGKRVEVDRGRGRIQTRWRLVSCRFVRPRRSRRTEQARTLDQAFEPRQPPVHVSQPAADPQRRRQDQPGQRYAHAQDADQCLPMRDEPEESNHATLLLSCRGVRHHAEEHLH